MANLTAKYNYFSPDLAQVSELCAIGPQGVEYYQSYAQDTAGQVSFCNDFAKIYTRDSIALATVFGSDTSGINLASDFSTSEYIHLRHTYIIKGDFDATSPTQAIPLFVAEEIPGGDPVLGNMMTANYYPAANGVVYMNYPNSASPPVTCNNMTASAFNRMVLRGSIEVDVVIYRAANNGIYLMNFALNGMIANNSYITLDSGYMPTAMAGIGPGLWNGLSLFAASGRVMPKTVFTDILTSNGAALKSQYSRQNDSEELRWDGFRDLGRTLAKEVDFNFSRTKTLTIQPIGLSGSAFSPKSLLIDNRKNYFFVRFSQHGIDFYVKPGEVAKIGVSQGAANLTCFGQGRCNLMFELDSVSLEYLTRN